MAKSFTKNDPVAVNDDLIREALKTGLSSIRASDDLLEKTLAKCQNEIAKTAVSRRNRSFSFMPLVYKIGAPLAAGALILVLALNGGQPLLKGKNAASAPEAAMYDAATAENSAMQRSAKRENGTLAAAPSAAASAASSGDLEIQFSEEAPAAEFKSDDSAQKFSIEMAMGDSYTLNALNSSLNRTKNEAVPAKTESMKAFKAIVDQYNKTNGTRFTLYEDGITRIQTLVISGVNSEMLQKTKSFRDLLSGEGYWLLPLRNSSEKIEHILNINTVDASNPGLSVSNRDLIVNVDNADYLVSTNDEVISQAAKFSLMFDSNALTEAVKAKGYDNIKTINIIDINYGLDYIIFVEADGKELGIPLLINENMLGLTNNSVYEREELFRIISQHIK